MKVKLLAVTKPEGFTLKELSEYAGRVCTHTEEKTGQDTDRFLEARIRQGHLSIFEHINLTFEISGISRACSHQLVRHRIASYSQQSMRYVKQSKNHVTPPSIQNSNMASDYERFMNIAWEMYESLIRSGIKQEDARYVLPIATKTKIVVTMNLRQWWHFIEMRTPMGAQWEIREKVAEEVKRQIDDLLNSR